MMFLQGKHATLGQDPPIYLRVDYGDAVVFSSKRPGGDSGTGAAAENHEIALFRLRHLN